MRNIHRYIYVIGIKIKIKVKIIFCIFIFVGFISCNNGENSSSSNIVRHPIEENIPYYNRNHLLIGTNNKFVNLQEKPSELRVLHRYLNDPNELEMKKLNVSIGSPLSAFNIVAPGNNRLVILDDHQDQLIEYDLTHHSAVNLAEFGRGPSDIHLPMEMVMHDDLIYIVREDMYISTFNCQSIPCEFNEAISLDFNPVSLAMADQNLALLGVKSINTTSGPESKENGKNNKPAHIFNQSGQKLATFGSMYEVEGHWMLLQPLVMNAMIRYSPTEHLYILIFKRFPYIYTYDASTLELKETYEISNFILGKQNYWPDEVRLEVPLEDFSMIRNAEVIAGNLLWIETQTNSNYHEAEYKAYWDRQYDYFVVDLQNQEPSYMGSYHLSGKSYEKNIYLTNEGLIIYDEINGNLFLGN